jgi:transposase
LRKRGFRAHCYLRGNRDEREIHVSQFLVRAAREEHSAGHSQAVVGRKQYSAEERIRIVLDGLRGESSIAELCRQEGIAEGLYCSWSKEFLEAGKRRLACDTARAATSGEVAELRHEARALKEVVAEQALELRLLKKTYGPPRRQG